MCFYNIISTIIWNDSNNSVYKETDTFLKNENKAFKLPSEWERED